MPMMTDPEGYFTDVQAHKILKAAKNKRDYTFIATLYYSGRRVSEVVRSLKPSDINYDKKVIRWKILKRKYPHSENIESSPKLIHILWEYIRTHGIGSEHYLFTFNRKRADQIIKETAKLAGITRIGKTKPHCHHFRHSMGIFLTKDGRLDSLTEAKKMLAHANINNTMVYLTYSNTKLRQKLAER